MQTPKQKTSQTKSYKLAGLLLMVVSIIGFIVAAVVFGKVEAAFGSIFICGLLFFLTNSK